MDIKTQINESVKDAMKSGDEVRKRTLRMVLAAVKQVEVDKRIALDDMAVVALIQKEIKNRREAIEEAKKANRPDLIESPKIHSGKIYFPMDVLYFVPFLRKVSLALLPHDSHGRMNLDSPKQGPRFAYARAAAVKRTQQEFEILEKILTPEMFAKFADL